jgi:NTE family protein
LKTRLRHVPAALCGIALATGSIAQERPDAREPSKSPRPKVGLVLAGGGARGAAHVGFLKVMEEMHIPVDYVAGTSMGSLVGALYSAGYSPAEMESIVGGIDWGALFRDAPERRDISFRRKEDDDLALFPIEFGYGKGHLTTQAGVLAGKKVEFLFRRLTLHTLRAPDFDHLNIPFRAVAADLDTGEAVVLGKGDLARAMRASMSLPAVFTPVVIDGKVLVDGGIAANLPVDVARDMGAEQVIAVDVGTPPGGTARDLSALGVYSQTFDVLAKLNVKEQIKRLRPDDLLVTPELGDVTTGGFGKIKEAIAAGEAAARKAADSLRRFSVSDEEWAAFLKRQRRLPESSLPPLVIDSITFEGPVRADPRLLRKRMKTQEGQALDFDVLSKDLERISQAGEFESVGFHIVPEGDRNRLVVDAREKSWGPTFIRFGIGVESDFKGDSSFRLIGNVRRTNINSFGAEWKTNFSLGEPMALVSEFYQPMERTGFLFVAPRVQWAKRTFKTFLPDESEEIIRERSSAAAVDVGALFGNYGELRLGWLRGHVRQDNETTADFEVGRHDVGGAEFSATLDQLDSVFFPTKGTYAKLQAFVSREGFGADTDYDKVSLSVSQAGSIGRNTLFGRISVGTDLGSEIPAYDEFELGGFLNLSGLVRGQVRGDVMGLATAVDYWRLNRLGLLGNLYVGAAVEAGNAWQSSDQANLGNLRYSGLAFLGLDSRLCPIYLGYGHAEGGEHTLYLFIGRPF